jgi:hypothetical protein
MLAAPPPYLDDAGFTDRVVEHLPPRPPFWRRRGFLLGAVTALSLLVGLVVLPGGQVIFTAVGSLAEIGWLAFSGADTAVSWSAILINVVLCGTLIAGAAAVVRSGSHS